MQKLVCFLRCAVGLLGLLSSSAAIAAAPHYSACGQEAVTALKKAIGQSDQFIAEMADYRAVPLNIFDNGDKKDNIYQAVDKYLLEEPNTALILYAVDGGYICSFVFTTKPKYEFSYYRQKYTDGLIEKNMTELARALDLNSLWTKRSGRSPVPQSETVKSKSRSVKAIVKDLSLNFFWPEMRDALKGIRHVSIVPVGGMSAVPIALLEPFGDGHAVIDLFSYNVVALLPDISYGPVKWPRTFGRPVIVGNPRPSKDTQYIWDSLPGAEAEAKAVRHALGGELRLGTTATKSEVLGLSKDADLLYFAAHGYSDAAKPLDGSFLVLGDGRLTAREVQALKFSGRPLVVLSACQTGEGKIMAAGVVGLARAFQIAGASNTLMSLWAVGDLATARLLGFFLEELKAKTPAEALRLAMLKAKKVDQNPFSWAAFNIFGNRAGAAARPN